MWIFIDRVKNIVGKGDHAGYQRFLLFHNVFFCFPQCLFFRFVQSWHCMVKGESITMYWACDIENFYILWSSKILHADRQILLTHCQTTNFRLFQTKRVCRWQFQIWRKWQKVIQTGRKHCGKRRNCSLRAISPFPTLFSKGLFPRGIKRYHCVGMG